MQKTVLSCGLIVLNEDGELLLGHSTGSSFWDLPKGLIDAGEDPLGCALREAREEFGLGFAPERLQDLGRHAYYRGKDLHLFGVATTRMETPLEGCACASHFEHPVHHTMLPEIDAYAWADHAALPRLLAHSMHRLLCVRGLLAHARRQLEPQPSTRPCQKPPFTSPRC
ncbi:NUDIX hydrolase [Hydrogenophaga sp. OTU3427]|uniref:NUDIX hydrolase n=1 Tax=Hydrogenophaga sp. OTU3427 TaxID=3043856 RepID=UPI00313C9FFA